MSTCSSASIPSVAVAIYEGRDPVVSMVQICGGCKKESSPSLPLKRCSRCHLVLYCSRDCQYNDFSSHKTSCKTIQKLTSKMKQQADALQRSLGELVAGRYSWDTMEAHDYMRARFLLANEVYDLACKANPPQSYYWVCVLEHYQELLRLCMRDSLRLRSRFPFLLLEANRDDDAANFIIYWLNSDDNNYDERTQIHETSSEGDWIYPRINDARFINILEPFKNKDTKYIDLGMLVAAACIKMRLVAIEMTQEQTMKELSSTKSGGLFYPVNDLVESMLPASDDRLKGQRHQLDNLLDIIHQNNPTVLPALLNPGPLLSQPRPDCSSSGDTREAYYVAEDAVRIWNRIPVALQILEKRFGSTPKYNAVIKYDH